jgi:hypothetical protein
LTDHPEFPVASAIACSLGHPHPGGFALFTSQPSGTS